MSTITTGKVIIYKPNFNVNPLDTLLDLPVLGAENTLYVIKDTGAIYIWNGSEFITYDSRPYKVYTALLSQTGTSNPVATVLENTLGGAVTVVRNSLGLYTIQSVDPLFAGSVPIFQASYMRNTTFDAHHILIQKTSDTILSVTVSLLDDLTTQVEMNADPLLPIFIEIRVYP